MKTEIDNNLIGMLTRRVPALNPNDSITRAAELMRNSGASALPVLQINMPVGLVRESDLRVLLAEGLSNGASNKPVAEIMTNRFIALPTDAERTKAMEELNNNNHDTAVVVDYLGNYVGILTAADLLSRTYLPIKPKQIGGLATPFGVFLTTGTISAGAGYAALMVTGLLLFSLAIASDLIVYLLAWSVEKYTPMSLLTWAEIPFLGTFTLPDIGGAVVRGAVVPIFLLLMRMLPLTAIHASEHQVVNAIERNEPLELSVVKRMPRVHARCGTNLAAGAGLYLWIAQSGISQGAGELGLLIALVITLLYWRSFGAFLQTVATTKPATDKQLSATIKVGEALLEKYRRSGISDPSFGTKFLNSGMLQVMSGGIIGTFIVYLLDILFDIRLPLIGF